MANTNIHITETEPVVVAMSGGVDSSVAAALAKKNGSNVVGVTLKLYDEKKVKGSKTCCSGSDILDAKKIANNITIPHYVLDYEKIFRESVIEPFINEYNSGRTPIPCINCNEKVKFLDLIDFAKNLNAKSLVTGHYIKKVKVDDGWALYVPSDEKRDQSYFLFTIKKNDLEFLEFPLGEYNKDEIRELAFNLDFHLHDKADSQDICFIPTGDYKAFLNKQNKNYSKGDVVDINGNVLDHHNGIHNFTIGQRRGLGVSGPKPLYVKAIDPSNNRIIVAEKEHIKSKVIQVENINYLSEIKDKLIKVRVRSSGKFLDAEISKSNDSSAEIKLLESETAVSPGQACVFYREDTHGMRLLGGGWIKSTN